MCVGNTRVERATCWGCKCGIARLTRGKSMAPLTAARVQLHRAVTSSAHCSVPARGAGDAIRSLALFTHVYLVLMQGWEICDRAGIVTRNRRGDRE